MKKLNSILWILALMLVYPVAGNAIVIENDEYNYKLTLDDRCSVSYDTSDSLFIKIESPDRKSTFYIVTDKLEENYKVFTDKALEEADAIYFSILSGLPHETDSSWFLELEDHYYDIDNLKIHTRTFLWNNKICLLVGVSEDDTNFVETCIENFESDICLGKFATYSLVVLLGLICLPIYVFFTDCKENPTQGKIIGTITIIIVLLILIWFFNSHYTLNWDFKG